jgi:hypothetical protein
LDEAINRTQEIGFLSTSLIFSAFSLGLVSQDLKFLF